MKLEPRALAGYLIGYDSTNIWRIWHPEGKTIIRSRDVTFDEGQLYHPKDSKQLLALTRWQLITEVLDLSHLKIPGIYDDAAELDALMDTIVVQRTAPQA